jgi:hypothetical protein
MRGLTSTLVEQLVFSLLVKGNRLLAILQDLQATRARAYIPVDIMF